MNTSRLVAATTIACSLLATPALAQCVSEAEARALQVRELHIQLQVASLNCRIDDPSLPGKYASYVEKFGGQLARNADVLKKHFRKTGGNLDRHMTKLANDQASRAHLVSNYCESQLPLFQGLSDVQAKELENFAAQYIAAPGNVCKAQLTTKAAAR